MASLALQLGLGQAMLSAGGPITPPQPVNSRLATLIDFPTDDLVFDSGVVRGTGRTDRNSALIPISGGVTESDGTRAITADATIEARATYVDGSGATAWQNVGTALSGATTWSGNMLLPRNASRYQIEVRVVGTSQPAAHMTTVCAVGHVMVIIGQSEHQRIGDGNQQAALTPPVVASEGRVRVAWRPNTETEPVEWTVVRNATPHSPAVAAMANALSDMRPDDHFTVVFQTKGATKLMQLANDADLSRSWSYDLDTINKGTGGQITGFGWVALDWTAGPGTWGTDYAQTFGRFFTKKLPDGTPMVAGDTYSAEHGSDTITYDHYWADLDPDVPVLDYGPHLFATETAASVPDGPQQVFQSAEIDETGALIGPMALKRMTRQSMAMFKDYAPGNFWPKGASPLLYRTGDAASIIPWSDYAHPGKLDNNQGLPLWAQQNAYIIGQMLGWSAWTPPKIEAGHVTWEPTGAHIEIDIGQTLSTVALLEGDASAEVAGFEVSGRPAPAEIVAGKIRVYHPDGAFGIGDTLRFGMGGASGVITYIDDIAREIWKRWPMVPMSFGGAYNAAGDTNPGIALEPVMDWETVFANPLALPGGSVTVAATATEFVDNFYPDSTATPWSGVDNKLTMQIRFTPVAGFAGNATFNVLIGYGTFDPVSLSLHETDGRVRVRARASNDTGLIVINAHTVTFGVETTLTFAVDFSDPADGKMWLRDGAGALLWSATGIVSNGVLARSVYRLFNGRYTGAFGHAAFWNSCSADGSAPDIADAYRVIAGTAVQINGHEWKTGTDVT
ncbi:hypothetical protein [Celeribacter neptunius]|uniref:Uncharacterized protein n=1 Tax=Celeribacter neptunius TaxID=588602 RepID=A0A1I3SF25_9RHOB|nr:hypothetical protein [Celeribacter neptunius]SFJ56097.1 hypothetical protein SAMN04487991_2407 [Celeribacter neptunius]